MAQQKKDQWVDVGEWEDITPNIPRASVPTPSSGGFLNALVTPKIQPIVPRPDAGTFGRSLVAGYNQFIQPMTSPLGAALTGFGGTGLGMLGKLFPKIVGAGLTGMGAYSGAQVPGDVANIYNEGPTPENIIGLGGDVLGAAALPFGVRSLRSRNLPEVLPREIPRYSTGVRQLTGRIELPQAKEQISTPMLRMIEGTAPERKLLPAMGETSITEDPRFFAGRLGTVDVETIPNTPTYDPMMQMVQDRTTGRFVRPTVGGINTQGIGTFAKLPGDIIAERGVGFGQTRDLVKDPFGINLPSAIQPPFESNIIQTGPRNPLLARPETILEQPLGGRVINPPSPNRPYNPNLVEPINRAFSPPSNVQQPYPPLSGNRVERVGSIPSSVKDVTPVAENATAAKNSLAAELFNLPRALKASMDLSAPFRQGLTLAHKKEFWTSFDDMFKAFGSEAGYKAVNDSIKLSPNFRQQVIEGKTMPSFAERVGLKLTDVGQKLSDREESFMSTMAENIPGAGKVVRASNRAYTGFLNKLRADTFDSLISSAEKAGLNPRQNDILSKQLAGFVNNATGRGSLGALEQHAVVLNNLAFSPRLIASRISMMNPNNYVRTNPMVRKEYWKSLIPLGTLGVTLFTLGRMAGGEVESNPTSSDFGKLKIGNTRFDPYGGFQQYGVLLARLLTGESKSSTSGNVTELGSSTVAPTRGDLLFDLSGSPNKGFIGGKLHPTLGFAMDWFKATNKRPFYVPEETAKLFVPMVAQDLWDIANQNPGLLPGIVPATFGVGVQTYGE